MIPYDQIRAVYIDRSGSMLGWDETLEQMLEVADLCPQAQLFGFGTEVWPITSSEDFDKGGGGTIWPLKHAYEHGPSLILTDGQMNIPDGSLDFNRVNIMFYNHKDPPQDIRDVYLHLRSTG